MPEYLAPGVYVEETSYRSKSIEGVGTSTAGFVGPARYGPISGEPELVTSFAQYERIYGGLDPLEFSPGVPTLNYLAQAVQAFFAEGGRRLYVSRVYDGEGGFAEVSNIAIDSLPGSLPGADGGALTPVTLKARFPGRAGNMRVTFIPRLSDNLLIHDVITDEVILRRVQEYDTVMVSTLDSLANEALHDVTRVGDNLVLHPSSGPDLLPGTMHPSNQVVRLLTVDVVIERPLDNPLSPRDQFREPELFSGFVFHPRHANALTRYYMKDPETRLQFLQVPFWIDASGINTGAEMAHAILGNIVLASISDEDNGIQDRQAVYRLENGSDGILPGASKYNGEEVNNQKSGLMSLEDLDDIAIVAVPGGADPYSDETQRARAHAITGYLIGHAERMKYRIAIIDPPPNQILSEVRAFRSRFDSKYAAMYYPWVTINDPFSNTEVEIPPSGVMAGIYARNDVDHGVHKAPANETIRTATNLEFLLNKAQQDVLNPEGVNCFRRFEGRGLRVWGARTMSSDPEWKYVNLRRYFIYLEHSLDRGTQWAVFENNGDELWANVTRTIEDFLLNEWKSGHLLGEKPQEAFFVRCDRTTMTQNDLDNGRLVCLIGVAPLRPAEFVIFRIGQWTGNRRF